MNCKVLDLVYLAGFGLSDWHGLRGHVGQIVGPAHEPDRDWSVQIPGRPSNFFDGTWAAKDSWLIPIRDNDGQDEILRLVGLPKETV